MLITVRNSDQRTHSGETSKFIDVLTENLESLFSVKGCEINSKNVLDQLLHIQSFAEKKGYAILILQSL